MRTFAVTPTKCPVNEQEYLADARRGLLTQFAEEPNQPMRLIAYLGKLNWDAEWRISAECMHSRDAPSPS